MDNIKCGKCGSYKTEELSRYDREHQVCNDCGHSSSLATATSYGEIPFISEAEKKAFERAGKWDDFYDLCQIGWYAVSTVGAAVLIAWGIYLSCS